MFEFWFGRNYLLGEKQRPLMVSTWSRVYRCLPSLRSQSIALASLPPEAQREPSGDIVTVFKYPVWPMWLVLSLQLVKFQTCKCKLNWKLEARFKGNKITLNLTDSSVLLYFCQRSEKSDRLSNNCSKYVWLEGRIDRGSYFRASITCEPFHRITRSKSVLFLKAFLKCATA